MEILFNKLRSVFEEVGEDNLASSIHQPRNLVKDRDPQIQSRILCKNRFLKPAQTQYNIVASPISAFQPGVRYCILDSDTELSFQ